MKLLWITNIILPPACEALGIDAPVVGGWMLSSAKALLQGGEIELAVATVYNGKELKEIKVDGITYYLVPSNGVPIAKYNKSLEKYWQQIKATYSPDVVHIHGTEMAHGLAYIRACGAEGVVVSIQGLVSVIERYMYAGMSAWDILKNITFRNIINRDSIFQMRRDFAKRGKLEQEYIRSIHHIIGRTDWDRAHALAVNPNVCYHFCNETLRGEFYKNRWSYEHCEKHTIFLSQAGYPIKGLHKVLDAAVLVRKEFPNLKIIVAGRNITSKQTLMDRIKYCGYGKFIKGLIKRYKLQDNILFTGSLDEQQICQQYLKANLFICPSSIENSPNSLGEAQLLGMPFLASNVGGAPDMVNPISTDLLYRFEEVEILAEKICQIFRGGDWQYAEQSVEIARARHNSNVNRGRLVEIYKSMCYE